MKDKFVKALERQVSQYEELYGMKSSEAYERLCTGTLKETFDVCTWIMRWELLERIKGRRSL